MNAVNLLPADTLLTIRVGPSGVSRARYHLESQDSIDRLPDALTEARRPALKS